jgi:hypothetical protein
MTNPPDCLVFKIEEYDSITHKLDNTVFVLYDTCCKQYVVRGLRVETRKIKSVPYSFTCKKLSNLVDFVSFIICKQNFWSYTLYNYNDLPYWSKYITFDTLYYAEDKAKEISGYDNIVYERRELYSHLRMLKAVFNSYE